MFDNIGYKIKKLATVLFWGGEGLSILLCWGGVAQEAMGDTNLGNVVALILGYLLMGFGVLVVTWLMYGFGHLVDCVAILMDTRTTDMMEVFEEEYQRRKKEEEQ